MLHISLFYIYISYFSKQIFLYLKNVTKTITKIKIYSKVTIFVTFIM